MPQTQIQGGDEVVTKDVLTDTLKDFYGGIYPFLNGAAHAGFTPVGTVISVMGNSAPQNYLACNGQVVNIADYPELANYFEDQFESKSYFGGNGTTTFAVPDLRGEFLRGTGTNGHTDSGNGANVGEHQESTAIPGLFMGIGSDMTFNWTAESGSDGVLNIDSIKYTGVTTRSIRGTNNPWTGGGGYGVRPTNTSVLYCIATKNIYVDARYDYSTTEKVVGTWIDGKPVYQKTVDFGALPNQRKQVAHEISNIDKVVSIAGVARDSNGVNLSLPVLNAVSTSIGIRMDITKTAIVMTTNDNWSGYSESQVTLQYTKTTD